MIHVHNKKHGDYFKLFQQQSKKRPLNLCYVGRPSALGNPFIVGVHGSREFVVERYRAWLLEMIRYRGPQSGKAKRAVEMLKQLAILHRSRDLVLSCYCSPLPCHAGVIKEILTDPECLKLLS